MKNMFEAAEVVGKQSKAKKDTKAQIPLPGLNDYAAIDSMIKTLEALKGTTRNDINERMTEHFLDEGIKLGRAPENYRGTDTEATASCELRTRVKTSGFTDEEIAVITEAGLAEYIGTNVKVPGTFIINPKYATNMDLLSTISEALSKVGGVPDDLFQKQAQQELKVSTEALVDKVFALKDKKGKTNRQLIKTILGMVTTLSLKPTLLKDDMETAYTLLKKYFFPNKEETPVVIEVPATKNMFGM